MANNGYNYLINPQLGSLMATTVYQSQVSPVQYILDPPNPTHKATFTRDFYINPVFGRPRLGIDYGELEQYENNVYVRMVISHIIDSVLQTKFNIIPIKEEEDISNDLQNKIDDATDFFSSRKWMEDYQVTMKRMLPDLLMYDAGVLILVFPEECYNKETGELKPNNKIPPIEMMSRDGRSFLADSDPFGKIYRYWQYSFTNVQARPIPFQKDEIIYLMMRPQSRSLYGTAPLQIIKDIADYLTASIAAQRKYYENNFPISGMISHDDITDPEELRKRAQLYKQQLKGENNTGKWLITSGGTKVMPLQISAQNMQWLQSAEYFQKLIFALFKIAPSELGFTDRINRATAITQSQNYKQNGVRVILSLIENYFNREIIWKYYSKDIQFKFDTSLDLQDKKIQSDIDHIQITDGTITVNEIRKREGKKEYEDKEFNSPFAQLVMQQKIMQAGMGGPEEPGESEFGSEEPEPSSEEPEPGSEESETKETELEHSYNYGED